MLKTWTQEELHREEIPGTRNRTQHSWEPAVRKKSPSDVCRKEAEETAGPSVSKTKRDKARKWEGGTSKRGIKMKT